MTATYDQATVTYDSLTVEYDGQEEEENVSESWLLANASGTRWVHAGTGFGFGR